MIAVYVLTFKICQCGHSFYNHISCCIFPTHTHTHNLARDANLIISLSLACTPCPTRRRQYGSEPGLQRPIEYIISGTDPSVWFSLIVRVSPSVAECQTLFWNQIEVSSQQAFRFNHAYLLEQINSKNRSITVALGLALLNWSCPLLCKEHTYIIIQYPDKENRNGGLSLLKLT